MQPLWRTVRRFLQKPKIKLPYDPAIPLLGIYPEKTIILYMRPNVHCSTIYNGQDMETTSMSIDRGMDKKDVVHRYNGVLAIKKNKIMPIAATWMDLEIVILSEVSQTQKGKYISLIRGI